MKKEIIGAIPENTEEWILDVLRKDGVETKKGRVVFNQPETGYEVKVWLLGKSKKYPDIAKVSEALLRLTGRKKDDGITGFECRYGNQLFLLVTLAKPLVVIHEDGWSKKEKENSGPVLNCYRPILEWFSQINGLTVYLHLGGAERFAVKSPWPDEKDVTHIWGGTVPVGEVETRYLGTVFGHHLAKDGRFYYSPEAAKGQGITVSDGEEVVAQLLGNNFYFLFPVFSTFNEFTSGLIFRRVLAETWNKWLNQKEGRTISSIEMNEYLQFMGTYRQNAIQEMEKKIKENQDEIEGYRKKLAEKIGDLKYFIEKKDFLQARKIAANVPEQQEIWRKHYEELIRNPDIDGVFVADGGLQVLTKTLTAEHGGDQYRLGSYFIRIGKTGLVSVWGHQSEHPDHVPHPHLPKDKGPCFGNATEAVTKAGAELRFADAINYVLQWLKYGYSPELVMANKIEEWPLVVKRESLKMPQWPKEKKHE